MKRFCFVSQAAFGHCDFGGQSFIRTAVELKHRGHQVSWVISSRMRRDEHLKVQDFIESKGIEIGNTKSVVLHIRGRPNELLDGVVEFREFLIENRVDCAVIDRGCVAAPFSAHSARVPWAVVGADGREWTRGVMERSYVNDEGVSGEVTGHGKLPGKKIIRKLDRLYDCVGRDDFDRPSVESYWATSPFLNLSFLPRAFYLNIGNGQEDGLQPIPDTSHFVGAGSYSNEPTTPSRILVTFGNTFGRHLQAQVVKEMSVFSEKSNIPVLLLTGSAQKSAEIRSMINHAGKLYIEDWMPYDEAFRSSYLVVGHGGTSHVWYGMREGVPLIAVPTIGDQVFNTHQIERMGIGCGVFPQRSTTDGGLPEEEYLIDGELPNVVNALLRDSAARVAAHEISVKMRSGGGVTASADLLEALAENARPITRCISSSCCC